MSYMDYKKIIYDMNGDGLRAMLPWVKSSLYKGNLAQQHVAFDTI